MKPAKIERLISSDSIAVQVSNMANRIAKSMPNDVMIVVLLRGSFMFAADLVRALHAVGMHPQIDFLTVASYGADTQSSGKVEVVRDLTESMKGRDVLIIDDILDSGRTLQFVTGLIRERGAKSVKSVVLLEKPGKRAVQINADFVGFTVPDKFVVGYGLDHANFYRELPYIGALITN
ncbi:MAG: hypoxanthine phosphoribosyltransferase [Rickettsiales bacterium]|jgi:hypoxanthine phosphoribosyltransferase|nr:hypoxanthine phosphoribosyltransferase [Rickettsiales bacterium]